MPNLVTYSIDKMRSLPPSAKIAEAHPERFRTVSGVFYATTTDPKGKVVRGEKMSFTSKVIDIEDALAEGFSIDIDNGLLTLQAGQRGRVASEGESQADVLAALAALRNPTPAPEPTV